MYDAAVKKLTDEMEANKNNAYILVIGKMLLKYLEAVPESAEKFIPEDKTIGKSFEEMKKEARKKAKDNVAMLTDQEGFEIVLKYFGVETVAREQTCRICGCTNLNGCAGGCSWVEVDLCSKCVSKTPEKKPARFDVNLDDLL